MSRIVFLLAKLARVDLDVARRALTTAKAQDDPGAPPPAEFARGRNAMVYALAIMSVRKPVHLYVGVFGLVAFPIYLASRAVEYFCGW
jgi:hypothetical protein